MLQENHPNKLSLGLVVGIALIQIFDIIIHAATNQLEPIRVSSNLIMLLWLVCLARGIFKNRFLSSSAAFICAYLILNIIFLAHEGLTNAAQGGAVRVMLLLFIILTMTLSTALIYLRRGWR